MGMTARSSSGSGRDALVAYLTLFGCGVAIGAAMYPILLGGDVLEKKKRERERERAHAIDDDDEEEEEEEEAYEHDHRTTSSSLSSSSSKTLYATDDIVREHFTRNVQFFGQTGQETIADAFVVVVGLGGVGSHCASMLYAQASANYALWILIKCR